MVKSCGFTLMELLITLTIIGILFALAIPNYRHYILKAHRQTAIADLLQIELLEAHYHSNKFTYTASLTELNAPKSSQFYCYSIPVASSTSFLLQADSLESDEAQCKQLTVDEKGTKLPSECWKNS